MFALFGKVAEMTGGTFRLEVHDVVGNDEHVAVLAESHGEREGKSLHDRGVQIFHVQGGKATEFWGYAGDQYAVDQFWS